MSREVVAAISDLEGDAFPGSMVARSTSPRE